MKRAFQIAFILSFLSLAMGWTQAAEVVASLDRASIPAGESAILSLRVTNGNPQAAPNFPAQPNLTVQFANAQQEYQSVNGRATASVALIYNVTATQPGSYTIPAVSVPVEGGASVTTQPVTLVVTKGEPGTLAAFLRIVPSKTNVYVGEIFPVELKVYGLAILQLQVPTLKSDGFTVGAQAQAVQSREQIGQAIYNVYSFPITVAAAKAGTLSLGPAEALMEIRIQSQNRRRGIDLMEEFLGGGAQRKQVTVTSEPVSIRVHPLPAENVPPSFNGAIGNFQITVKASPTNVAVGDPITMDVKIQGKGSFDTVKLPDFGWKDFTLYPPNVTTTNRDPLGLQALKSFDQVLVPQRAGLTAIPEFIFSFFDPDQKVYRTLQKPPIPITVRATGQGQAQPTVVADQATQTQNGRAESDIVHIKPALGQIVWAGAPLPLRPWFFLLQLAPIAIFSAAWAWRKRQDRLANDPRLRRQIEVSRHVASGLAELTQAAAKNQSEQFFATGFRLLQEQLGERLDLPAAAITEAVVDEKLPKAGASPELLSLLRDLFQTCNQARYAGATVAGMEALIPKFESALREIQKLPAT